MSIEEFPPVAFNFREDAMLNGTNLGVVWTKPFAIKASKLNAKDNILEVRVTNLWPNRLIRDSGLPENERLTKTNHSPYKPTDPLLPSGLLGPVSLSFIGLIFRPPKPVFNTPILPSRVVEPCW